MAARTKARKRALDVLFESEVRGLALDGTLQERIADLERPMNDYTVVLVRGVAEHQARIDELLSTYSEGWTLDRMPVGRPQRAAARRCSRSCTSTTSPTRSR